MEWTLKQCVFSLASWPVPSSIVTDMMSYIETLNLKTF